MREESECGIRKWEEMWFYDDSKYGSRGRQWSCDVRWKTVLQSSGRNRKCSVADSGQTTTSKFERPDSRDVDEAEKHIRRLALWLQCLLQRST